MQLIMEDFANFKSDRQEIILSLQEKYFRKIINGQKRNEYRFNFVKGKSKAYIYLPKDKQCIVGIIYLGVPVWHSVESASKVYSECGDGEYQVMCDWLKGRKGCYVIPIESYYVFKEVITKEILKQCKEFNAPQTYLLLDNRPHLKALVHKFEANIQI